MSLPPRVSVVGLGYVGLPLAVALARHVEVVGFDHDAGRIAELRAGHDRTREIDSEALLAAPYTLTGEADAMVGSDVFILTVPTPVDAANQPDLSALLDAAGVVGARLAAGAVVVLESTVYPGVTEEVLGPALARASGLVCGRDFHLGYSPERVNPGDREHRHDRIVKVVAGQTAAVTAMLAELYGVVTSAGVHVARNIKTAEAAKVIENAQRDINIAFINEVTRIFHRLDISMHDVLDAAATKWNFLDFRPGLVGGHCIGVDPFYLAHSAHQVDFDPEIVLAGRRINEAMGGFVAEAIAARATPGRALVLGLSFKENVPDLRNSKVADVIAGLAAHGFAVDVHDPLADADEAARLYDVALLPALPAAGGYDAVVGAVAHDLYRAFTTADFAALAAPDGLIADVKGMWRDVALPAGMRRWQL